VKEVRSLVGSWRRGGEGDSELPRPCFGGCNKMVRAVPGSRLLLVSCCRSWRVPCCRKGYSTAAGAMTAASGEGAVLRWAQNSSPLQVRVVRPLVKVWNAAYAPLAALESVPEACTCTNMDLVLGARAHALCTGMKQCTEISEARVRITGC
jgi:hypothetical protein